jgi:hypothetical protein
MTKACLLALLSLLSACDELDNCPDPGEPITVSAETTKEYRGSTDLETLTYESAPWDGPLQHFPPETKLRFVHDLGFRPQYVFSWISFTEHGTHGGEGGDVTENTGNQGRIQCVDAHEIIIENDTCEEDFYIRVAAWAIGNESTDATECQKELER